MAGLKGKLRGAKGGGSLWVKGADGKFKGSAPSGDRAAKIAALQARVKAARAALETNRAKAAALTSEARKAKGARLRSKLRDALTRSRAAREGLKGHAVPQGGLRSASFAHLRSGGAVHGGPPRVKFTPGGGRTIVDGRHRITIARERGEKSVDAIVYGEGKRGGVRWRRRMKIPI